VGCHSRIPFHDTGQLYWILVWVWQTWQINRIWMNFYIEAKHYLIKGDIVFVISGQIFHYCCVDKDRILIHIGHPEIYQDFHGCLWGSLAIQGKPKVAIGIGVLCAKGLARRRKWRISSVRWSRGIWVTTERLTAWRRRTKGCRTWSTLSMSGGRSSWKTFITASSPTWQVTGRWWEICFHICARQSCLGHFRCVEEVLFWPWFVDLYVYLRPLGKKQSVRLWGDLLPGTWLNI